PKPAPIATPMPMLATAAPTPAPSTTPTNTLNGKAAAPQRKIFVPWLRFFPLTVIIPDTGLTRQYQSLRLTLRFSGGGGSADNASHVPIVFGAGLMAKTNPSEEETRLVMLIRPLTAAFGPRRAGASPANRRRGDRIGELCPLLADFVA